jgi:glycosyltransferase involved in cell wall biosynthesis
MGSDVTAIVTCMTDAERPFMREALQSVRDQTMQCEETIAVVLESNTWIDEIAADFPHIKVMRRPPGWEGAARHTAIDVARTEFVAFLDGDDVWLPNKTSRQLECLRHACWDLVGADYIMTTEEGKPFAYGLSRHMPPPSAWMVRRETMLRYPFDANTPLAVDWQWWLSTWHTVRRFRLPEPLMKYRVRGQSLSTALPVKRRKLALSKLSSVPTARPLLLAATYALYRLYRRREYAVPKGIPQGLHARGGTEQMGSRIVP